MPFALMKCVCAATCFLALFPALPGRAEPLEWVPLANLTPRSPLLSTQEKKPGFDTFAGWDLASRVQKDQDLALWLIDPWGFQEASWDDQERAWQNRLRQLGERMQDSMSSDEDPTSALWHGMRAKSEPTGKVKIRQTVSQQLWYSKAKIDVPEWTELRPDPYSAKDWRAEETLRMSIPSMESMFVFGHFNSNADAFQYRQLTAVAKTGFGWKWSPIPRSEVQLRGGPMVSYTDTNSATRLQEKSLLSIELFAEMPLLGPFQLEYTGAATTGTLPTDQNLINQDLRIALPIGKSSEFYFGAKQRLDSTNAQTLWNERRQVYIGVELKH